MSHERCHVTGAGAGGEEPAGAASAAGARTAATSLAHRPERPAAVLHMR